MSTAQTMDIAYRSDVGRVREANEDSLLAGATTPGMHNSFELKGLIAVADGVGGHARGEVASHIAAEAVRGAFLDPNSPDFLGISGMQAADAITAVIQRANARILAEDEEGSESHPATTLTVVLLRDGDYLIGHIGDTRAYLVSRGGVEQLTRDDTFVNEAVARGEMTPEEAARSPFRNRLTKCLGTVSDPMAAVMLGSWSRGDVIIVCSDGLSEYVDGDEIASVLQQTDSLQGGCDLLVDLANARGGHDNISVAAARNDSALSNRKPETLPNSPAVTEVVPPPRPRFWLLAAIIALAVLGTILVVVAIASRPHGKALPQQISR